MRQYRALTVFGIDRLLQLFAVIGRTPNVKIDWPSEDGFYCLQVASYVVRDKEEEESEVEVLKVIITYCYIAQFSI